MPTGFRMVKGGLLSRSAVCQRAAAHDARATCRDGGSIIAVVEFGGGQVVEAARPGDGVRTRRVHVRPKRRLAL